MHKTILISVVILAAVFCSFKTTPSLYQNTVLKSSPQNTYNFISHYSTRQSIEERIPVPGGFQRTNEKPGSFADWLRHLPLKPGKSDVHLHNGKLKANQNVHFAVVDIDVGSTDIQQCADAVMRMRAEYLYSVKNYDALHFNFTNGTTVGFRKWSDGYRTAVQGNKVSWVKKASKADDYKTFKNYCNTIFNYAGTASLCKELKPVSNMKNIQIGDVFIVGGFPGHAILVVDVCENKSSGEKLFMIQQSYMPAQEIHILKNYNNPALSPWYSTSFNGDLITPEWTFKQNQLMRFP